MIDLLTPDQVQGIRTWVSGGGDLVRHIQAQEERLTQARKVWAKLTKSTCVADLRNGCVACDEAFGKMWDVLEMESEPGALLLIHDQEVKEFPGEVG